MADGRLAGVTVGGATGAGLAGAEATGLGGTGDFGAIGVGAFRVGLDSAAREEARFRDFGVMVREIRMPAGDFAGGRRLVRRGDACNRFPRRTFR